MKSVNLEKSETEYIIKALKEFYGGSDEKAIKIIKRLERAMKPIKPRSAKSKGRDFQYEICQDLADLFNVEFSQKDDNCEIHSREMGLNGTDIILRGNIYDKFPFDIECKNCETLSVPEWIRQAKSNTKPERDWLLVMKNKKLDEPVACLPWGAFLEVFSNGMV